MIKVVNATERREYYLDCPYCGKLLTTDSLTLTLSEDAVLSKAKTTCAFCGKTFKVSGWD